jgi:hypothetical protein
LTVLSLAEIRVYKGHTIPRFRNTEFQDIRSKHGSVSLVRPQIAGAEIRKYEGSADYSDDRAGPVRSYLNGRV